MYKNYYNNLTVLDEAFLSEQECIDIKDKLLSNRNYWQNTFIKYFSYFPTGMYNSSLESYKENVQLYKKPMFELFSSYYIRLLAALKIKFGIDLNYHENLNYPGFHISNGVPMELPNFHVDSFPQFGKFLNNKEAFYFSKPKILSVILVINVLEKDTGLLFTRLKNISVDRHVAVGEDFLEYKPGMLAVWDGDVLHSIKPFKPSSVEDYRITMQSHVALSNNKGIVFW